MDFLGCFSAFYAVGGGVEKRSQPLLPRFIDYFANFSILGSNYASAYLGVVCWTQAAHEPICGQAGDLLQRPWLLEEMRRPRNDL